MNKDVIKYALIAVGAYLLWKYIQDHGGLDGVFGTALTGGTGAGAGAGVPNLTAAQCAQMLAGRSTTDGSAGNRALLARANVTLSADQELQIRSCGAAVLNATQLAALSRAEFSQTVPTGGGTNTQAPVLDVTGLIVTPDINDALTGIVKINGVPVRISIITSDGRIFGEQGTQIEESLIASGVNLATLRAAFQSAPVASAQASGELAGLGWASPWMMQ